MSQCICCESKTKKTRCPHRAKYGSYCGIHKNNNSHIYQELKPLIQLQLIEHVDATHVDVSHVDVTNKEVAISVMNQSKDISHMNMRYSLNKLSFDVVKSGLQKSIRRCDEGTSLAYLIEGDLYSLIESQGKAKGNRTNLVNRLRIILIEDLFNWRVIVKVAPCFSEWTRSRNQSISRKYLISIVRELVQSPKIRLLSDMKVFMLREIYRQQLGTSYDDLFNGWNEHGEHVDSLSRMIYLLEQRNPNCLYWYNELHNSGDHPSHDDHMWSSIISLHVSNPQLTNVLRLLMTLQSQLPKDHRERYLYAMAGICFILVENRIDWNDTLNGPSILPSDQEVETLYQSHLDHWTPSNLPYGTAGWLPSHVVVDKHTQKGRTNGMTSLDFANEGSLVINEDQGLYFPRLRQIYNQMKVVENDPSLKPKDVIIRPLQESQKTPQWTSDYLIKGGSTQ
jgi:hypothetical protein